MTVRSNLLSSLRAERTFLPSSSVFVNAHASLGAAAFGLSAFQHEFQWKARVK